MPCIQDFIVWGADVEGRYLVSSKAKRFGLVDIMPEAGVYFVGV